MLPENLNHFFRYQGSLTTPPCYESILWTVFDTPITLSHNQVQQPGRLWSPNLEFQGAKHAPSAELKSFPSDNSCLLPQIRKLESTLMDINNKTLWNDYRIAQPLNDRVVESSFLPRLGKGSG